MFMYPYLQPLDASSSKCLNDGLNASVCLCMGAQCSNEGVWGPFLAIQRDRCQVGSVHRSSDQVETWRRKGESLSHNGTINCSACVVMRHYWNTKILLLQTKKRRWKTMKACIALTQATTTTTTGAKHLHRHTRTLTHKTIPYEVRNTPTHTHGRLNETRNPVIQHKKKRHCQWAHQIIRSLIEPKHTWSP